MEDKILATEAWKAWEEENKYHPSGINPHAFVMGYEITKAKTAISKDNFLDELRGYLSDEMSRLYAKRDFNVRAKNEPQIHACTEKIRLLENIFIWIKAKTTT